MRRPIGLVGLMLAGAVEASAAEPGSRVERFSGIARSDKGALVYNETHEVEYRGERPVRSVTRYFDPAGKPIGELVSDYRQDRYAPTYQFKNAEGVVIDAARPTDGGLHVSHRGEGKVLERDPTSKVRMVCGQGLHQLVRTELDALARGAELLVRFAIPSRLDSYAFKIEREGTTDPEVVRLRIGIDSWVLSLLAPSLEVDYDRATRRLLAYRGVSNLEGPGGEPLKVTIHYEYPKVSSAAVTTVGSALAANEAKQ